VLLAYSGGQNSSALLALIKDGLSQAKHKQLKLDFVCLAIDESCYGNYSPEEFDRVCQLVEGSSVEVIRSKAESVLEEDSGASGASLLRLYNGLKDESSKRDFVEKMRTMLIARTARKLGIRYVFVADNLDRLAVRVLSDVALGAGSAIQDKTAFADERQDVIFLRPLRDVLAKETALYCKFMNVPYVVLRKPWTGSPLDSSIQRLLERFVFGVSADFPATTFTLCRTAAKLTPCVTSGGNKCCYCSSKLDRTASDSWSVSCAVNAVDFSKLVSNSGPSRESDVLPASSKEIVNGDCCGNGDGSCRDGKKSCSRDFFFDNLCFSCTRIFEPFRDQEGPFSDAFFSLTADARKACAMEKMREEISEFLLD
jgi:cytoplasmic tRNA 2-thiolation protein 2